MIPTGGHYFSVTCKLHHHRSRITVSGSQRLLPHSDDITRSNTSWMTISWKDSYSSTLTLRRHVRHASHLEQAPAIVRTVLHSRDISQKCDASFRSVLAMSKAHDAALRKSQICASVSSSRAGSPPGKTKSPSIYIANIKHCGDRNNIKKRGRASGLLVPVSKPRGVAALWSEPTSQSLGAL